MTIDSKHWLEGAIRAVIPGGSPMPIRRCAVVHFTAGATALSTIDWWKKPSAKSTSAHVVIDRDGKIFQCRPFNKTTGHAGVSRWRDPETSVLYKNLNRCSIGVELANAGEDVELARRWSSLPLVKAKHRNESVVKLWEAFPPAQISACAKLLDALTEHYKLDDITGHDCIAPERKVDPGPAFPMKEIREYCSFRGIPVVYWP
jgi:N-acetylmuramoyl-L-alanine amidase